MSDPVRWMGQCAPVWDVAPPPPRVRKYERYLVYPGKSEPLIITSHSLHELRTHFTDGRTVPCTGETGKCWLDHKMVGRPRYEGWLAIKHPGLRRTMLVALTPVAVALEPRLREMKGNLRGLTLLLWREGDNIRSQMNARLLLEVARVENLDPEPDVKYLVTRMMASADRPDGKNRKKYGALSQFSGEAKEQYLDSLKKAEVKS